ncbi:tetratricopeptide repeat protein [Niastella sp. OAS944]|uniref:tetratricopeptide repeat protein n=1 Tax=Niastella sp. OAS944 TaxID=2664089 RepID=UPI003492D2EF|nr:tetratricopeptide (TPR) repeat protein [Chitinophagaceae bacterium OAS944]
MFRILPAFFVLLIAGQSFAQGYKADFDKVLEENDTAAQRQLLYKWQQTSPKDAELFIARFNYYFLASRKEIVQFTNDADKSSAFEVKDSTGAETVGYLGDQVEYDQSLLKKAFKSIDSGISAWPARLDMRFGKIYALGQLENYEAFTKEIINTIEVANKLKNNWQWTAHQKLDAPEKFMLGNIQSYVVQLYNVGDDQLTRMRRIAQAVLKYYPRHVESLSNLAITYGLQGNYDKALEALLKAEKIMPQDAIVLNNIATMYERKGDRSNAIRYFELTAKHGDQNAKSEAAKKLKELKN